MDRVKSFMSGRFFFDLRNVYKQADMEKAGFRYFAVGQ
jgi:hypothetical protein